MLNEKVIRVLKNSMWDVATCANGEPNVVPVYFKDVIDGDKLVIGDVFMQTTLDNIKANNGRIAISAYNTKTLEGYQIKGKAEYVTEGNLVNTFKKKAENLFKGAYTAKGALIITPERVIVTTPGADNKKEL
jgi:predicted pyridoxine 5'-phosphate oxidase superfamily flavin-nucleotide-binding protein